MPKRVKELAMEFIPLSTRVNQVMMNLEKFNDGVYDWSKELDFTRKPFDFYGSFVRINEDQKHKFCETKLVAYYKSLLNQIACKD
jgi:hypothetical protein